MFCMEKCKDVRGAGQKCLLALSQDYSSLCFQQVDQNFLAENSLLTSLVSE